MARGDLRRTAGGDQLTERDERSAGTDRAEEAFAHVQRAATELIAAARAALDVAEEAVSTAGVPEVLDRVSRLAEAMIRQVLSGTEPSPDTEEPAGNDASANETQPPAAETVTPSSAPAPRSTPSGRGKGRPPIERIPIR